MKQTKTAHAELPQLPNSAEKETESNSNSMLVSRELWEDSPLSICSIEEETKWFIALGTKRLTEYYPTKEHITTLLEEKSWNLIIQIMVAVADDSWNYRQAEHAKLIADNYKKSTENLANFNKHQAEKHGINLNNGL